jgi:hypothetical protein
MNIFNRVLVVLGLLGLLALAALVAIYPVEVVGVAQRGLENAGAWLDWAQTTYPLSFAIGRVTLIVLALLIVLPLLWAELRPRRPHAVKVRTEAGSQATVTADSVSRRLAWHLDQLADVISAAPQVVAHGQSVDITVALETTPEIDVPMKTDEVVKVTQDVIVQRMGLRLGKVQVNIRHAPYLEQA